MQLHRIIPVDQWSVSIAGHGPKKSGAYALPYGMSCRIKCHLEEYGGTPQRGMYTDNQSNVNYSPLHHPPVEPNIARNETIHTGA